MSTPGERPPGPRPDWGTVCRWIDAGKPPLNPDGTWDPPALAAAPSSHRQRPSKGLMMDLIVNTWNTSDPAPLSVALIIASIITAAVGCVVVALVYDKTRRRRKIAGLTIGIVTTLALATMITVTYSLPRVENPNAASYIEASGTVDTITPDLNRDDPALAAGTILDCASTPTSFRNSKLDDLFPPDIPGSAQTTTTAIHIVDEPNQ